MSDNTTNDFIVIAAALMAQTTDPRSPELVAKAVELKRLTDPGSRIMKAVAEFDGGTSADGNPMTIKHLTGTVLGIMKEASSTRGVVSIYTGTDHPKWGSLVNPREHPLTKVVTAGVEHMRTDRTDNASDTRAKEMANHISKSLIGHKVNATLKVEETQVGKVRVLISVDDLGWTNDERAIGMLPPEIQQQIAAAK